jgi:hypothetical protein
MRRSRWWRVAFAAICLSFALAAVSVAALAASGSRSGGTGLPPDYSEVVLPYRGHWLRCVEWTDGTSGAPSGMSCDWVGWHKEAGR